MSRHQRPEDIDVERGEGGVAVPPPRRSPRLARQQAPTLRTFPEPTSGNRQVQQEVDLGQASPLRNVQNDPPVPNPSESALTTPPPTNRSTPAASTSTNATSVEAPGEGTAGGTAESEITDPCPICRDSLGNGHITRNCFECNSCFHAACLEAWSGRENRDPPTCPMCRSRRGYTPSREPTGEPDPMNIDTRSVSSQETVRDTTQRNSAPRQRGPALPPLPGIRQNVSVAPQVSRPRAVERSSPSPARSEPIIPGYTSDGKQILYARNGRAVVKDEDGNLSLYTAAEAGGNRVLNDALALDSVGRIETDGWKELKADFNALGDVYIEWAVPAAWDPYSTRLPEIMCCVVHHQGGQRTKRVGSRSNVKLLFGNRVADRMIAESLHPSATNPEEALEQLHGVTRLQRANYWRDNPTLPRSARGVHF